MQETKATATQRNEQLQPELAEQVIPSQPGLPYVNPAADLSLLQPWLDKLTLSIVLIKVSHNPIFQLV